MQNKTYVQFEDDQLIQTGRNSASVHERPGPSLGSQPTVALTAVLYSFCHLRGLYIWIPGHWEKSAGKIF